MLVKKPGYSVRLVKITNEREDNILEYGVIISDKIKEYQKKISVSLSDRYVVSFSKDTQELKKIIISGSLSFIVFDADTKYINFPFVFNLISSFYTKVHTFLINENVIKEDMLLQVERFIKYKINKCFCLDNDIDVFINFLKCLPIKDLKDVNNITEIHNRIIGKSKNMEDLRLFVSKVARHDYPVLLFGKIGFRKSAIAKLIHDISKRSAENFVRVDMGSIPENLAESILFGSSKVDTTRAFNYGLIDNANKGTLFLNEIEKTSVYVQGKLLKLLETKIVKKGGRAIENAANFKLICASNVSLKELVAEGKFRQDLYYKLSVQSFCLWELDKRKEDIPLLVEYYCKKKDFKITEHAITKLVLHNWKGNIRELFNTLDRSFIEAHSLRIIYPEDIHFD